MTATDSNGLSKSKCLLCNKGLRYLDIITQVSLMHVKFKTISNMHMVCRLDKNTCKLFQCDMVYLTDLSKFWFYVRSTSFFHYAEISIKIVMYNSSCACILKVQVLVMLNIQPNDSRNSLN